MMRRTLMPILGRLLNGSVPMIPVSVKSWSESYPNASEARSSGLRFGTLFVPPVMSLGDERLVPGIDRNRRLSGHQPRRRPALPAFQSQRGLLYLSAEWRRQKLDL
jgi:hypothetical protein